MKYPIKCADYEVEVHKGNFLLNSGNEHLNNKYCFHVYRDNKTPFLETSYLFDSPEQAFDHYINFYLKDKNDWIIRKFKTNMLLWYKPTLFANN